MYDEICYKQHFLKQVIARVDFFTPVSELEKAPSPKLTASISRIFPIIEPVDVLATSFQVTPGAQPKQQDEKHKLWNYFGKNREKQLSLSSQSVFVVYNKYTTFEELKIEFLSVITLLDNEYKDITVGRFGLRYINTLEHIKLKVPTVWRKYINKKLLEPVSFFTGKREGKLTRLFHVAELKFDEMNIKFQFGMPNPDFPAIIKRPVFVLDIDASVSMAHKLNDVAAYMDKAHENIQSLFEDSITPELREMMNGTKTVATI